MSGTGAELRRMWRRSARYRPSSWTGWIIVATVAVYVVELIAPLPVETLLGYNPCYTTPAAARCVQAFGPGIPFEPWRMLTVLLVHSPASIPGNMLPLTHILFNMYALAMFGRSIENVLGGWRLLVLYVLSGLGGSVAVLWASAIGVLPSSTYVIGASGAVFGVLGAVAAMHRRLGGDVRALVALIAINLVLGLVLPGIAWEAHVGGLIVGVVLGWLLLANRGPRRLWNQLWVIVGTTLVLVVLSVLAAII